MLHSAGYRTEATAVALAREYRSVWRQYLLTLLAIAETSAISSAFNVSTMNLSFGRQL